MRCATTRSGRLLATMTSPFYGPKIFYTDDPAGEWEQAEGVALPEGGEQALERIWVMARGEADGVLYAGGDPGVLFESSDGGASWTINEGLWSQPTRLAVAARRRRAVPALDRPLAGGSRSAGRGHLGRRDVADRGRRAHLAPGNEGLNPRYIPEEALQDENAGRCVHHVERAPGRPERLFMQFHGGVYRSDDGGQSWTEIGSGLPSDFGFPLMVDPADPDSAYVIPLVADMDRVTPEGRGPRLRDPRRGHELEPRGGGPARPRTPT